MPVESLRRQVPGKSPVDVRPRVLGGEPEDGKDGQPPEGAGRSARNRRPRRRWPATARGSRARIPRREKPMSACGCPPKWSRRRRSRGSTRTSTRDRRGPRRRAPRPALSRAERDEPRHERQGQEDDQLAGRKREGEEQARENGAGRHGASRAAADAEIRVPLTTAASPPRTDRLRAGRPRRGSASSARYEERTNGPAKTWRKPSASPASRYPSKTAGGTYSSTGQVLARRLQVLPDRDDVDAAALRSFRAARAPRSRVSPRPSMKPDFVVRPGTSSFAAASTPSDRSSVALRGGRAGRAGGTVSTLWLKTSGALFHDDADATRNGRGSRA